MAILMGAASWWAFFYALELLGGQQNTLLLWKIQYLGIVIVPGAWFIFALSYTGETRSIRPRLLLLLAVEPLIVLYLAATNEAHGLIWKQFSTQQVGRWWVLVAQHGPAFILHSIYSYLLIFGSAALIFQALTRSISIRRSQSAALLIALLLPVIANLSYIAGLNPVPEIDLTPYAFSFTGLVAGWAISRFRLLQISPVAYSAILDGMPDGLVVLDHADQVVHLNDIAAEILKVTVTQAVGRKGADLFSGWMDWPPSQGIHQADGRETLMNGRRLFFETYVSELQDEEGQPIGHLILLRDVTHRCQAEEQLLAQQDRLRFIVDHMPAIVWTLNRDLKVTSGMGAALESMGVEEKDTLGLPLSEFNNLMVQSRETIEAHRRALAGESVSFEIAHRHRTFHAYLQPLRDIQGEIEGVIGVSLDITDRKRAEMAVRAGEEYFRQSVMNSPNPIFSVDREGRIQAWNLACQVVFQHGQEMLGQKFSAIIANDNDLGRLNHILMEVFESGSTFNNIETTFRSKDGSERYMVSRLFPLRNLAGDITACVCASTDITERQQAEVNLRRQVEELTILHAVAAACVEAQTEDGLIERVTEIISQSLYMENFGILLMDKKAGSLYFHPSYHGLSSDNKSSRIPLGEGITGRVAASGIPWRVRDVFLESEFVHLQYPTRSELCVPIQGMAGVMGVINTQSSRLDFYTDSDEHLLTVLAGQIATSLERLRAEASSRLRLEELQAITRVNREITSMLELQPVLESIAHHAVELGHADASGIFTIRENQRLYLAAADGVGDRMVNAINAEGLDPYGTAVGQAIREKRPVQIPDIYAANEYSATHYAELEKIRAVLALPLLHGEEIIGGLVLWHRQPRQFTQEEELFLQALAQQSVNAVVNARLFEAEREQRYLAELLRDTGATLSSTLDPDAVLDRLLDQIRRIVPYDAATFMSIKAGYATVIRVRGMEQFDQELPLHVMSLRFDLNTTPNLQSLVESRHPQVIPNTADDPGWKTTGVAPFTRSWAGFPIVVQGQVAGLFSLDKVEPGFYQADHIERLDMFASQASLAWQNALLFAETRRRAAHQEVLNAIIAAAVIAPDLPYLLESAMDRIFDAVGVDKGGIWVGQEQLLRGLPEEIGKASVRVSNELGIDWKSTVVISDWSLISEQDPMFGFLSHLQQFGLHSILFVPVMAGGKRIGGLSLASADMREWLLEEVNWVETVGRQLGSAVERLNLMAKTQEQARQVQMIMDTVPDGVLLLDTRHRIVLANPAARTMLEVLADNPTPADPLASLGEISLDELLRAPVDRPWHEIILPGVSRRTYELAARPLEAQETEQGWVLVIRDVTHDREIQHQVQMQERLATVGQLAAGIAHDFNNIMAAIVVYTDLLAMEANLPQTSRERLAIIQQQVQRAASLIRQILDFSRRSVMEQSELDLLPFIKELDKLLGRVLPENIRLELSYQPGFYLVHADPTRLQQVFMNLAVNARDAMPDGGVLQFELKRLSLDSGDTPPVADLHPGNWLQISIQDSGHGITPEVRPHIFDPFFTTKPVGQGTGLGLAQVYGIIKQHGGSIDVESQEGDGTKFTLYLPEASAQKESSATTGDARLMRGNGEMVMVVEDDWGARDALKALLESQGYEVLTAVNGAEALRIYEIKAGQIDVVVSDVVMPGMGGVELFRALRETDSQIKILLITGHPLEGKDRQLLEQGQVKWLQKPFSVQEFSAVLRGLLNAT